MFAIRFARLSCKLSISLHAGFTGFTGSTGFTGFTGFTGSTGFTGATGALVLLSRLTPLNHSNRLQLILVNVAQDACWTLRAFILMQGSLGPRGSLASPVPLALLEARHPLELQASLLASLLLIAVP